MVRNMPLLDGGRLQTILGEIEGVGDGCGAAAGSSTEPEGVGFGGVLLPEEVPAAAPAPAPARAPLAALKVPALAPGGARDAQGRHGRDAGSMCLRMDIR